MPNYRVYVRGYAEGEPVASHFTVEAETQWEAPNEAKLAAEDCGWTEIHAGRGYIIRRAA